MNAPCPFDSPPSRICIHAPNWVGDVVMATPLMRCVRETFPSARILLLIRERVEPVVQKAPWFDDVLSYSASGFSSAAGFFKALARLREKNYNVGLILPNSFKTALLFFLVGVKNRVGYLRDARHLLLNQPRQRPEKHGEFKPVYMVDYYLGLCENIGLKGCDRSTELCFSAEDVSRTKRILAGEGVDLGRPLFLFHPGAAYGPSKKWPERRWARLGELLQDSFAAELCLIGGEDEAETCRRIENLSGAAITNLQGSGLDLHLLKCLVSLSGLLVTTDSGPRHYGVACGIPTVCLMGPTHPGYSTSGTPHDIVIQCSSSCGPCQKKVCPEDHRCMDNIPPRLVFSHCVGALMRSDS